MQGKGRVGRDSDSMENVMFFLGLFVEFCEGVSLITVTFTKTSTDYGSLCYCACYVFGTSPEERTSEGTLYLGR